MKAKRWIGILFVICGLALIGVADYLLGDSFSDGYSYTVGDIILGDALIILGQLFGSIQMVYEERFIKGLDINACQAIGWEGVFGFTTIVILQIIFYWTPSFGFSDNSRNVVEDAPEAFMQMGDDKFIILLLAAYTGSISFFNFAGISITKELSATTRTVMDTLRTFFIYLFSLFLFKQEFHWLQVLGFLALFTGMWLYNNLSAKWIIKKCKKNKYDVDGNPAADPSKQLSSVE